MSRVLGGVIAASGMGFGAGEIANGNALLREAVLQDDGTTLSTQVIVSPSPLGTAHVLVKNNFEYRLNAAVERRGVVVFQDG